MQKIKIQSLHIKVNNIKKRKNIEKEGENMRKCFKKRLE